MPKLPQIRKPKPQVDATPETIAQALEELALDRPYYVCRVVGGRLEFTLLGGDVVYWPPKED